ncbi:hypothetical protein KEM55_008819, partial [Ascosphaera atra]
DLAKNGDPLLMVTGRDLWRQKGALKRIQRMVSDLAGWVEALRGQRAEDRGPVCCPSFASYEMRLLN